MIESNTLEESKIFSIPKDGTSSQVAFATDQLLQASRRVDWRFLLPDPNLGRVVYIGQASDSLALSLQLASKSLTVIETNPVSGLAYQAYDVVAVSACNSQSVREIVALVKPLGYLYVEVMGMTASLLSPRDKGKCAHRGYNWNTNPAEYTVSLRKLGFTELQTHWHWPDFETCRRIVPLGDRTAILYALNNGNQGSKGWLRAKLGEWLLRTGLLPRVVPCYSVLGKRDGHE